MTIVRTGYIDHSDSAGATARFGMGDVQWFTAGKGVVHSEMFPLLNANGRNDLELFQIWLNLPAKHKMVPAYFSMLWDKDIPRVREQSPAGAAVITVIAGALNGVAPLPPPPAKNAGTVRTLHLFRGAGLRVGDHVVTGPSAIRVRADLPLTIDATNGAVEMLLQQAFDDYRRTQFGGWPFPENAPVFPRDAGRFAKHADGRVERVDG